MKQMYLYEKLCQKSCCDSIPFSNLLVEVRATKYEVFMKGII